MAPIPSTGALVEVYRLPDYDPIANQPTTAHGVMFGPEKNGPGRGRFTIAMADDPAYGDIQINDVAAIRRGGGTVEAMIVEQIDERTLDEQGAARQTATYIGRLVDAFPEWAVIAPALGDQAKPIEDDCILDWRSLRYNPATYADPWENSSEIMTVTAARAGGWPTPPAEDFAQKFTDSTGAFMIWHSSGDDTDAPVGYCPFLFDVVITDPGRHGLEVLMDNDGMVWVDGIQQLEIDQTEGYHVASFKRIFLTTGTHRLAFLVRNLSGPAALAYNLFKTDHQDRPMKGVPVVAMSNSDTQVLEYPDPLPGMTVGDDLTQLLAEAQVRGALTWLAPSFGVDDDSNSDPFDRISVTTKTGTTNLLQFLDELTAAGHIARWRILPDGVTFEVYAPGYSTRPTGTGYGSGFTIVPATGLNPATGEALELNRKIT